MARFDSELPRELLKQFEDLNTNCEDIFGEMVQAGGEVVLGLVKANMGKVFKSTDSLYQGLKKTRVYKTPSDDGINVHIGFYGYNDKGVPIPLIANAREYGTSRGEAKKPFFRKSFKKKDIESAMLKVQKKYIKED